MKRFMLRAVSCFSIALCLLSAVLPFAFAAESNALDYNDYVDYIVVDGDNDICTVSFPVDWLLMTVKDLDNSVYLTSSHDSPGYFFWYDDDNPMPNIEIDLYPFGTSFSFYASGASYGGRYLDMSNIPGGATFTMVMSYSYSTEGNTNLDPTYTRFSRGDIYDGLLTATKVDCVYSVDPDLASVQYITVTGDFEELADGWTCGFRGRWAGGETTFAFQFLRLEVTFSISALYRMQEQMGQTNELLEAIESQLADQGHILDDILTGGDSGEDLIAGGDQLADAGADLGSDLEQIEDFENSYMAQLDDQLPAILASADINFLYAPLMFVQHYLDLIVSGIPSGFLVVFTLPALLGILLYVLGHPIRAPRPDTSGDVVTRETFTTTTVLSGRNAGASTTTRTVTSSQEIGRQHASDN